VETITQERIENRVKELNYKIEVCEMRIEFLKEEFIKSDRHIILMEISGIEEKIDFIKEEIYFLKDLIIE
jgi:hypothetical protein